jgi:hypothetical protein
MSAYEGLHSLVGGALMGLDTAICERERTGGSGYTAILIPANPREPIAISLDGKPANVEIGDAVACALMLRGEASEQRNEDLPPEAFGVELDPLPPWAKKGEASRADHAIARIESEAPRKPCSFCNGTGTSTSVDAIEADGTLVNPREAPCMFCEGSRFEPEDADVEPPVVPSLLAFMPQEKRAEFVKAFNAAKFQRAGKPDDGVLVREARERAEKATPAPEVSRLTREAYQGLIDEDIAWCREQPRTLEREHVIAVLKADVDVLYARADVPALCDFAEQQAREIGTLQRRLAECERDVESYRRDLHVVGDRRAADRAAFNEQVCGLEGDKAHLSADLANRSAQAAEAMAEAERLHEEVVRLRALAAPGLATVIQQGHEGQGIDVAATLIAEWGERSPKHPESDGAWSIVRLVLADMKDRAAFGLAKYGRPLRPHDGRDSLVDMYQEALDGTFYARKGQEEGRAIGEISAMWRALVLAIKAQMVADDGVSGR